MVVLSVGLEPQADAQRRAPAVQHQLLGGGLVPGAPSQAGAGQHLHRRHLHCGRCQGPKDIPDTVAQAGAAAAEAMALIDAGYVELEPNTAHVIEEACSGCKTCLTICPYTAISFLEEKKGPRQRSAL